MPTDTIRVTYGRSAVGTLTADIYPIGSDTALATGAAVSAVGGVTGRFTFPAVSPTANTAYEYHLKDSSYSGQLVGFGWFIAKNDGSTIDELAEWANLRPTVSGRTLDVSSGGEAGIDWANVGSPTTTVNLSATTISTGQTVATVTNAITLPTIPTDWLTSTGLASSAVTEISNAVLAALGTGTWMTNVPWNAAWDAEVQSECTDALTAYAPATSTDLATLTTYVDTEVAAIKAKTDNLPASPAAVGSAMTLTSGERDSIATSVWASTTRSLTTFGTLVSDVSTAVWSAATRTLSGFGTLVADVWAYATRTLTSGGGGGGSTTVVVHPGYASWAERVFGQVLVVFHNEAGTIGPVLCQRLNNRVLEDIDLSALTGLYFLVKDYLGEEVYTTSSVTISGAEDSQFTVPITITLTGTTTKETEEEWHYWSLRDEDDNVVVGGRLRVQML